MGLIIDFTQGDNYIKLNSDGWSGNVISRLSVNDDDRKFQFLIDFTLENGPYGTSWVRTILDTCYGIVSRNTSPGFDRSVVGISLEHFGTCIDGNRNVLQMLGRETDGQGASGPTVFPAWGVEWDSMGTTPTQLNINDDPFSVENYTFFSAYSQSASVTSSIFKICCIK